MDRLKFIFTQFIEEFKSGKFASVRHGFGTPHTTDTPTHGTPIIFLPTCLTTQS